jgi:uncharacterized Ntn-hydrolase superfamily protein
MSAKLHRHPPVATFSIVAGDPRSGDLGIAVASKFLACGAVVPWASAGAGAVATQSFSNTAFGPEGIALMRSGMSAESVLEKFIAEDPDRDGRQVGMVDARGGAAAYTGAACNSWAGHVIGEGFTCQGNLLVGKDTVDAMASAFRSSTGALVSRLFSSLAAGEKAGGDRRGRQAAALYVVRPEGGYLGKNDVLVDLRVDDHPGPIGELGRLLDLHQLYFGSSPAEEKVKIDGAVLVELKRMMRQTGHYKGEEGASWDVETADALSAFFTTENFEERVDLGARTIDSPVLGFLRNAYGHK